MTLAWLKRLTPCRPIRQSWRYPKKIVPRLKWLLMSWNDLSVLTLCLLCRRKIMRPPCVLVHLTLDRCRVRQLKEAPTMSLLAVVGCTSESLLSNCVRCLQAMGPSRQLKVWILQDLSVNLGDEARNIRCMVALVRCSLCVALTLPMSGTTTLSKTTLVCDVVRWVSRLLLCAMSVILIVAFALAD